MSLFEVRGVQVWSGNWHISCAACRLDTSDDTTIGPYGTRRQATIAAREHAERCLAKIGRCPSSTDNKHSYSEDYEKGDGTVSCEHCGEVA